MTTERHADFEALSAFVDGEAPEWADHVAGCPQCRATAARLRALSAAVGEPVAPPSPAERDRAIAVALGGEPAAAVPAGAAAPTAAARHRTERARVAGRRPMRPWAMPAAAAVVVGLLGLSGFVLSADRSDDTGTFAGPALEADTKAESGVSAQMNAPAADLGDIADVATLRMRASVTSAGATMAAGPTGASSSSANSGAAGAGGTSAASGGSGGAAAVVGTPTTTLTQRAAAPAVVGPRPCEEQARAREPGLGSVVYYATARQGNVPAYVLGFSSASSPLTLLLLAQDGCRELLRSAGP